MRDVLLEKYNSIYEKFEMEKPLDGRLINQIIKEELTKFMSENKKVAIYCNGGHTQMLMTDFIYELKAVKYIVDNFCNDNAQSGFRMIRDNEMEAHGIDAIIISSYKFKESIKETMKKEHPSIKYLDLYEKFEEKGVFLKADYYYHGHAHHYYQAINALQREIRKTKDRDLLRTHYHQLTNKYIQIKDFRTAIICAEKMCNIFKDAYSEELLSDLQELYDLEIKAYRRISANNVLMLCVDGLRKQDFSITYMPKCTKLVAANAYSYDNAYSFSTSTYESLIPVYSENTNQKTRYFDTNSVSGENCRFIQEAHRQGRTIYFYTDMMEFVEDAAIKRSGGFRSATDKMWEFVMDSLQEENGLFYIHISYESHYSFANPYTEDKLLAEGTAMLFDYLPVKGGKLRADYIKQHTDAIRYLDDVMAPFLEVLRCRMLLFADHGNILLEGEKRLEDIPATYFSYDNDWIHIPYVIFSPECGVGKSDKLISLMTLNDIVIDLMKRQKYVHVEPEYIKIGRSEIYNPDFRYLYSVVGMEQELQAFELFIFKDGEMLVVYADGGRKLLDISGCIVESRERVEGVEVVLGNAISVL